MSKEGFPSPQNPAEAPVGPGENHVDAVRARIEELGGEEHFRDKYGLGVEELSTHVEYGNFKGPLLDAVVSTGAKGGKECPVGGDLAEAKAEEGIAGVADKLQALGALAGTRRDADGNKIKKFDVKISEENTKAIEDRENQKKK